MNKHRLSASVDADLIRAAERAVADGRAESVSAWVNEAMRRQVEHDQRLRALRQFVEEWEADHGEISQEQIDAVSRNIRRRAIVVRGGVIRRPPKPTGGRKSRPSPRRAQKSA